MGIYLSLGSNCGDRRAHIKAALSALTASGIAIERISPVVESPALLPPGAPADWNAPFLNMVIACHSGLKPEELLGRIKGIERSLGRNDPRHWAPRPIDIDILVFDDIVMDSATLTIPHPELARRAFVLSPLAALAPELEIPPGHATALELSRRLGKTIPLWMGIINLTPDSFSDGGVNENRSDVEYRIDAMTSCGAQILDFGAESTRPGATPLTADEEWARLGPVLERTLEKFNNEPLRPSISVDTYHPSVAARALELGVDIINDVGGLSDPEMRSLAADTDADFIAMHNLGLPADPKTTLDPTRDTVDQVSEWLDRMIGEWQRDSIALDRIIFDPGIGFGKNPLQSLDLMRGIGKFHSYGIRLLVGHSRKSFMAALAEAGTAARDLVTIGGSLKLCERGVEILRVHNVADHLTAWRGWAQLERPD